MASQSVSQDLPAAVGAIHNNQELCEYLILKLNAPVALGIRPSRIHIHGSGLFAKETILEGSEIFRNQPFVSCVKDGKHGIICDHCYADSDSKINTDGNFRIRGDVTLTPKITMCSQCGVCGYCSEDCRVMAWEKYHRSECEALKMSPTGKISTRILYRVLAMHKQGTSSEQEWRALRHIRGCWAYSPYVGPSDAHIATSKDAKTSIQSQLAIETVQELLDKIRSNRMAIKHPPNKSPGATLDLVGSFVNHSCDLNAFVFFQGNQLRMRSLKRIKAGDEITITYVDPNAGVMWRKKRLQATHLFTCSCTRCKREHRELQALATQEGFSIKDFTNAERTLDNLKNQIVPMNFTIDQIKPLLTLFTNTIFPTRPWPDTLYPMGDMKFYLANRYSVVNNHHQATIHAVQGCLSMTARSGPDWVKFLHLLIKYITNFTAVAGAAGTDTPDPQHLRYFFNGVLHELLVQGRKTYGTDTEYTIALERLYAHILATMDSPVLGEEKFEDAFKLAQASVLEWAEVDEKFGLDLSIMKAILAG